MDTAFKMTFLNPNSAVIGLFVVCVLTRLLFPKRLPAPLPPGPPPKPLIGNLKDLPSAQDQDWIHWWKFKDLYGPISSLTTWGQTFIILNDARFAVELFEHRSKWHSDRPHMRFAGEMSGCGNILGFMRWTNRPKAIRKAMNKEIGSKAAISRFNGLQKVEARRFLLRVLQSPKDLTDHIRKEAGAVVLKLTYGYTIEPHARDPLVDLADVAMQYFSLVGRYGDWLVDFVPFLKYLPAWFPGAEFVRIAQKSTQAFLEFGGKPYAFTKQQMSQDNFHQSYLSNLLESEDVKPGSEREYVIKWSAASLYAGGADTTVSTMSCFFLAMALYPEVQRKAQEEIDRVVGERLPEFSDRESLPYIEAMVKELLRWHPVVTAGVSHVSTHDDMCNGYFIPKGSNIINNVWAFTRDPEVYSEPNEFKPERFLGENPELDPRRLVFGFGRRICPGRVLADSAVYINIAESLAVFNITKKVENGKVIEPKVSFQPGLISHPEPYEVTVKPRSPVHEELIRAVEVDYPWEPSHAADLEQVKY
ncbi:cytochrome P450 [Aspergillus avenaceus]|uniref:Cytochrome P450 n=1 Tax=Aspergillus avenaceus TaxID=36643 RepID=A0A5N6TKS3_ASPAV|nr:cytochrome P450 [Aspergillus avenaceus]